MSGFPDNFPHKLVRSKRCTLALQIASDATLIVRAPMRLPEKEICGFVSRNMPWILRKQEEIRTIQASRPARDFKEGEIFHLLGFGYPLVKTFSASRRVLFEDGKIQVSEKYFFRAKQIIEKWYREEAYEFISRRVFFFEAKMRLKHASIKLNNARTRWASCALNGNLNFNWRLIMAPSEVIDYVVVHELAHLVHSNHSAHFWNKVKEHCPDYQTHRSWLHQNGKTLEF